MHYHSTMLLDAIVQNCQNRFISSFENSNLRTVSVETSFGFPVSEEQESPATVTYRTFSAVLDLREYFEILRHGPNNKTVPFG